MTVHEIEDGTAELVVHPAQPIRPRLDAVQVHVVNATADELVTSPDGAAISQAKAG